MDDEEEAEELYSGKCGSSVTWVYTSDGVLTISGTGTMYGFYTTTAYWREYEIEELVTTVVIEDGVDAGQHTGYGHQHRRRLIYGLCFTGVHRYPGNGDYD